VREDASCLRANRAEPSLACKPITEEWTLPNLPQKRKRVVNDPFPFYPLPDWPTISLFGKSSAAVRQQKSLEGSRAEKRPRPEGRGQFDREEVARGPSRPRTPCRRTQT
jgi:hypothetical protein